MLTLKTLEMLKDLARTASPEHFSQMLVANSNDLFDAAELAVTPLNTVAKRFLEAVDQNKVLKMKIQDLEKKVNDLQDEIRYHVEKEAGPSI